MALKFWKSLVPHLRPTRPCPTVSQLQALELSSYSLVGAGVDVVEVLVKPEEVFAQQSQQVSGRLLRVMV